MRVFSDRRCLRHEVPPGFPESPERLEGVLRLLESSETWLVEEPGAREGWLDSVTALHDLEYVDRFRSAVQRGDGLLDSADNPISSGTFQASRAAVETALAGADAMVAGNESVFAAVRPPGHHAERGFAMGFCYFNTIAVAAEELLSGGLERVAIFDFDVHHGNGTQHLFSSRADVLYVSIHQFPFYPGTGAANERGTGAGEGATLNLPMPAGTGDAEYLDLLETEVTSALEAYRPDALLLSAGFDAYEGDPLGGMRMSQRCYFEYGQRLAELAQRMCGGRTLSVLEGGYNLNDLPSLVDAYLRGLSGR